jgi:hypothetical protein
VVTDIEKFEFNSKTPIVRKIVDDCREGHEVSYESDFIRFGLKIKGFFRNRRQQPGDRSDQENATLLPQKNITWRIFIFHD